MSEKELIMNNKILFLLYSLCVGIYFTSSYFMLIPCFMKIMSTVVAGKWIGSLIMVLLSIAYMFMISWLHNIIYFVYFKIKGYQFQTVNLFPVLWVKDNQNKMQWAFYINCLMELHTQVSFSNIRNSEECRAYILHHKKCIKIIFVFDIAFMILSCLMAFISLPLTLFLVSGMFVMVVLNCVEPTEIMMGGIWKFGIKRDEEYHLFLKLPIENCNKKEIYSYIQENYRLKSESLNGKIFMIGLLMDSLYDEIEYMTPQVQKMLEDDFLFCSMQRLKEYGAGYFRLIKMYYQYIKETDGLSSVKGQMAADNWTFIEQLYSDTHMGNFMMKGLQNREIYNINDKSDIYNEKINLFFSCGQ